MMILVKTLTLFFTVQLALLCPPSMGLMGKATFYTYIDNGSCGFGNLSNRNIAALSPRHPQYGKAQDGKYYKATSCGMKCRVRCAGPYDPSWQNPCKAGWTEVTVTDTCPECAPNHIDLSREALGKISNISIGGMVKAEFDCRSRFFKPPTPARPNGQNQAAARRRREQARRRRQQQARKNRQQQRRRAERRRRAARRNRRRRNSRG